jgi:CysZ protein
MTNSHSSDIDATDAVSAFFGGIGFVALNPRIWRFAVVPAILLALTTSGFALLGIWGSSEVSSFIFAGASTGSEIGYWIVLIVLALIAVIVAMLLGLLVTEPLSAFALEAISVAQQHQLTGSTPDHVPFLTSACLTIRCVGFGLMLGLPAIVGLIAVNLVFPPATLVTVPLKFLVCAWLLAWNILDYPFGLRRLGIGARLRWVMRHPFAFTTFGALWALIAIVPGIVLVFLPMGVAGATRLVIAAER